METELTISIRHLIEIGFFVTVGAGAAVFTARLISSVAKFLVYKIEGKKRNGR